MRVIIIDTEQAAIIASTLDGVSAFLTARATRRDPAGFITKAYKLQDRKVANLKFQLQQGGLAAWPEIESARQLQFLALLDAMRDAKTDTLKTVCYQQIIAFIFAQRGVAIDLQTPTQLLPKGTSK